MSGRKRIVILTGAGISAESGLRTFRDSGGLWEGYQVSEVATPDAWERNPELVLRFYNERRRALALATPNAAHAAIAALEQDFEVHVITQNVDDLHERAGSTRVVHLHGELKLARSTVDGTCYPISGTELNLGDTCPCGEQLRPHIVWFGEPVPEMEPAIEITSGADAFVVVGTSLAVYPAASLIDFVPRHSPVFLADLDPPRVSHNVTVIAGPATVAVPEALALLTQALNDGATHGR